MYGVVRTKLFEKSFRKLKESGALKSGTKKDLELMIAMLTQSKILPVSRMDHQLHGKLQKYRECHIKGNLLLEYERRDDKRIIILVDIGTHTYLFGD